MIHRGFLKRRRLSDISVKSQGLDFYVQLAKSSSLNSAHMSSQILSVRYSDPCLRVRYLSSDEKDWLIDATLIQSSGASAIPCPWSSLSLFRKADKFINTFYTEDLIECRVQLNTRRYNFHRRTYILRDVTFSNTYLMKYNRGRCRLTLLNFFRY